MNEEGATDSRAVSFTPGSRVRHDAGGVGKGPGSVLAVDGDIVTVRFDSDGEVAMFVAGHPALRMLGTSEEGRISPPWAEIHDQARFLPALTPGERDLARYLDSNLEPEWRIYVRPHLDADHPVIAAIHPRRGGMVWDVVGWDLNLVEVERDTWWVTIDGERRAFVSPLRHLDRVREKLYGTYLPEIGESINQGTAKFSLVRAGLFFPNASTEQVHAKVGASLVGKAISVFGRDSLKPDDYREVVGPRGGSPMQPGWDEAFDRVLRVASRICWKSADGSGSSARSGYGGDGGPAVTFSRRCRGRR